MADDPAGLPFSGPAVLRRAALTGGERRIVALAALAPIPSAMLLLVPFAVVARAGLDEVVVAGLVYGGLLGLAGAFVAIDRLQARQCPLCTSRSSRGDEHCTSCGYDLAVRPRFACSERHAIYLEEGLCECGRRIGLLPAARGIAREVTVMLRIGAFLLAFLLAVGIVLRTLAG